MNPFDLLDSLRSVNADTSRDELLELVMRVEGLGSIAKEAKELRESVMIDWIEINGDLVMEKPDGPVRWYVGSKKTTKVNSVPNCIEALLISFGGDLDKFAGVLASNPFKYGACREPLGEQWGNHFTVSEVPDLKTGKPKRTVQQIDEGNPHVRRRRKK
ncbi:MAG: hypothetical protein AAGB34_04325 [Planctomycetota bacterium]